MTKETYRRYLKTKHWQQLRQEVLRRANGRCEKCGYSNTLEFDDLLQECFLALENAVNSYSFEHGTSFMTYLYSCTKKHLNRVITKHSNFTENQLSMILQIKEFRESYKKQHGRMPDNGLVMREFFISRDYLRELDILKDLKVTSIDVPIGEDDESTLAELLPGVTDLEEKTIKKLSIAEFWEILNDVLLPAESEVIKLFYLDNLTVSQIAAHVFRHTFATRAIESGMQPQVLKTIMGHSSLAMTMDLYSHVMEDTKAKEMQKIASAF